MKSSSSGTMHSHVLFRPKEGSAPRSPSTVHIVKRPSDHPTLGVLKIRWRQGTFIITYRAAGDAPFVPRLSSFV